MTSLSSVLIVQVLQSSSHSSVLTVPFPDVISIEPQKCLPENIEYNELLVRLCLSSFSLLTNLVPRVHVTLVLGNGKTKTAEQV